MEEKIKYKKKINYIKWVVQIQLHQYIYILNNQ
jgi:hypothetical protein